MPKNTKSLGMEFYGLHTEVNCQGFIYVLKSERDGLAGTSLDIIEMGGWQDAESLGNSRSHFCLHAEGGEQRIVVLAFRFLK